jgi:hypothetical protein
MRVPRKALLVTCGGIFVAGGLLYAAGVFSRPRDYSSPDIRIKLVDQYGAPVSGVEVSRYWYDSDFSKEGNDVVRTDASGTAHFPKVSANVGLFTGAAKKALTSLGSCGSGSGTGTQIYVRYAGQCEVIPRDKTLHRTGHTYEDQDGVIFYTGTDSLSNTMANLSFPGRIKEVDYVLSSSMNIR